MRVFRRPGAYLAIVGSVHFLKGFEVEVVIIEVVIAQAGEKALRSL